METSTNLKRRRDSGDSDKEGGGNNAKTIHRVLNLKNNQSQPEKQKFQAPAGSGLCAQYRWGEVFLFSTVGTVPGRFEAASLNG